MKKVEATSCSASAATLLHSSAVLPLLLLLLSMQSPSLASGDAQGVLLCQTSCSSSSLQAHQRVNRRQVLSLSQDAAGQSAAREAEAKTTATCHHLSGNTAERSCARALVEQRSGQGAAGGQLQASAFALHSPRLLIIPDSTRLAINSDDNGFTHKRRSSVKWEQESVSREQSNDTTCQASVQG